MEKEKSLPQETIIYNIIKILKSRNLPQACLAAPLDIAEGNVSKLLHNKTRLTYDMLANIASYLAMPVIDIITWPDKYVRKASSEAEPIEAILQIKLKKDKKDQVLKLVFGENNIEILNK
jgi:DNA-binding Xre family transcriptional regulator